MVFGQEYALLLQSADLFRDAAVNPRSQTTAAVSPSEPFAPDVPMDEYLTRVATLSPWVPCPDPVARRMLDLAGLAESPREAAGGKIHYDLGCGDGRVNFAALDVYVPVSNDFDLQPRLIGTPDNTGATFQSRKHHGA